MTQAFLLIVTASPDTRFDRELEFFKLELEAFTRTLVKFYTRGPVPKVEIFVPGDDALAESLRSALVK